MNKIQVWINISIAAILLGELLLFPFQFVFSIPILFLKQTWAIQVGVGYCIILLNLKIRTWPIARRTIALVVALPLCCWGAISFSGVEQVQHTAQLGENRYYFTTKTEMSYPGCDFFCNFTVPALYKCNLNGLECVLIFHSDLKDVVESDLVIDKDANELQLFLSYCEGAHGCPPFRQYGLYYVYGKRPRFIEASAQFGNNIYYLTTPQNQLFVYMLYKCNQDSLGCKRLPFEYIDENKDIMEIDIDDTGSLNVIANNYGFSSYELLVYTYEIYSSQPVCHVEGCSLKDE